MEIYPKTLMEFERMFATEEACREYLALLRRPDEFRCPRCDSDKGFLLARGLYECAACHRQTSITAATIFQDTRKPLQMWFRAMWHVTNEKTGVSAASLQRALGLGSYQTAWTWLQKLRRAMVRPGRDRLSGEIEVETLIGGKEEGVRGRQTHSKMLVVIAAQVRGTGIGRIRMRHISDASAASLVPFIQDAIEPGSTIITDGWGSYAAVNTLGYGHQVKVLRGKGKDAATRLLSRVHRVAGLVKRWILGTHQGSVSPDHLDYYLDEYTFRFNRRTSRNRGKLFYRLVQQAAQVDPVTYKEIVD
jgi:transposase-like protein/DNA-directed RNA polymerase subunit RPC12/RpoP